MFFLVFYFKRILLIYDIFNIKNYNIFDLLCLCLLLIKLIKYLFDITNIQNLYSVLIWIFLYVFFRTVIFLLNRDIVNKNIIIINLILISLFSCCGVIISFFLMKLGYETELFWHKKNSFYPYAGTDSLHYNGFMKNYNLQAYIMIPGYFFLLSKIKSYNIKILVIIFFGLCFFIIKSKVFLLILSFTLYYLFLKSRIKHLFILNTTYLIFISILIFVYFTLTHFLLIEKNIVNNIDEIIFLKYYSSEPLFAFQFYEVYSSLFFNLKSIAIDLCLKNNFLFFNDINFNQFSMFYENYRLGIDPHSDYFDYLSNFGFFGLVIFLFFYLFFFNHISKKLNESSGVFFVYSLFIIESIVSDMVHMQIFWLILSILYFLNKNEKFNDIR